MGGLLVMGGGDVIFEHRETVFGDQPKFNLLIQAIENFQFNN